MYRSNIPLELKYITQVPFVSVYTDMTCILYSSNKLLTK